MIILRFTSFFIISVTFKTCKSSNVDLNFPKDFLIGAGSSALQIEGAWNLSGKAESVWDYYIHNNPSDFPNNSTIDVACDSYNNYKEDIQLLNNIGVDHYRFSMSWSRILPTGYVNYINKEALQYYHNILDELEKKNIIPFVTIYHWDHPQSLEKIGGWLNEEMAYLYAEYARLIFQEFGHRVKIFITVNEPAMFCTLGYESRINAPAINAGRSGKYICVQNMLKGHALAYHLYNKEFRNKQKGQVGITYHCSSFYNKGKDDYFLKDLAFEFECGWQANPIFSKQGDYPKIMKKRVAEISKLQGYISSKLPSLSNEWTELIKGSADFFGLNHYLVLLVSPLNNASKLNWSNDEGLEYLFDHKLPESSLPGFNVFPKAIGDVLRKIKTKYDNPPIYITENGIPIDKGLNDVSRINYLGSYMKEVLQAIKIDNCNVKAYTIWSLLDSFEFSNKYKPKFGLVDVNFNDEKRSRTLKKSAYWLKSVIESRKLP